MTLTVVRAAPYLTVQDLGRRGFRDVGVPPAGAMDRFALAAANVLAGNDAGSAALEWSLGGGVIRFNDERAFALGGATADASLDGEPVAAHTRTLAAAGSSLEIGAFRTGRFLYVAVEGGIAIEPVLGSRSTYLPAHFGGLDGRLLKSGDILPLSGSATAKFGRENPIVAGFTEPPDLDIDYSRRRIRVVRGPQWQQFPDGDRELFFNQPYSIAHTSDRTGYRLTGTPLIAGIGSLPSEAVCAGAIQVPPDGLPIVLMADSPTVGGYAKIGVVEGADMPVLAQLRPGESFQFEETPVEDSQRRVRRQAAALFTLASLMQRR